MLKRLIEVALPLKEVSEQAAREKSIRHGHISTLHIWWARRPLAACRAVVFASLIPDPDAPDCPESFRQLVRETLSGNRYKPKDTNGGAVHDTPRGRCLEFIKHLVRWENSNEPEFIEPARRLIKAAHAILHPESDSEAPKVLDPFAGGGAIPLEALRLGCEAHAVELNPVAHLIELCTLVYPQKYGRPGSRPTPDYIRALEAAHEAEEDQGRLDFKGATDEHPELAEGKLDGIDLTRLPLITDEEYQENPLAADVKFWGHWVLEKARDELAEFYPPDPDGSVPVAYLWARTVKCPNPACGATIPLVRQLWLCKKKNRKVALRMTPNSKAKRCDFEVAKGKEIDFDASEGTVQRGNAECPFCHSVAPSDHIKSMGHGGQLGAQLMAIVSVRPGRRGQRYRASTPDDERIAEEAGTAFEQLGQREGPDALPQEPIPSADSRAIFVHLYGLVKWGDLFASRQALALTTFVRQIRGLPDQITPHNETDYAKAVTVAIGTNFGRAPDHWSTLCAWNPSGPKIQHVFGRQALPMVWDYAEANPFGGSVGDYASSILWNGWNAIKGASATNMPAAIVRRGSATRVPAQNTSFTAVMTDPPYYDAVPYSELSDFFYVWHKRSMGGIYPDLFQTPLTPKTQELIAYRSPGRRNNEKTPEWYEAGMADAFAETARLLQATGVAGVMFAHKTTSAWEALIGGLIAQRLLVTASWPFHTEMRTRLRAMDSAALASSVTLMCRKRATDAGEGLWDDVRRELREVAGERLDFFWDQGIRGADFFISAIGPALSVFGKYERVKRLSGEEVSVKEFLAEVRSLVTDYVLAKVLKTGRTGAIDTETQFYVAWRWAYGSEKVPADEAFTLAKALGLDTEAMWDRTGTLEKSGQNVRAEPVEKRGRVKDLGEPAAEGARASMVDVLHRLCAFRDEGETQGAAEFLARSGFARDETLWMVAQAVSEILPAGDKEKQLLQGLLAQRDTLTRLAEEATGLF